MKIGPYEVLVSEQVPDGELWFVEPLPPETYQRVERDGSLVFGITRRHRVVGKIINLLPR